MSEGGREGERESGREKGEREGEREGGTIVTIERHVHYMYYKAQFWSQKFDKNIMIMLWST